MKKIGLVMACCSNYGALLQSYATQQVVKKYGFETEIIIYESSKYYKHIKFDFGVIPFVIDSWLHRRKISTILDINDDIHVRNKKERHQVMLDFCRTKLENRNVYRGYSALCKAGEDCDAVLIGSDQMWHPGFSFGNHISLRFVPRNIRTISYATSLGVTEFPRYCWNSARSVWNRINYLSVREEQGRSIIRNVCGDIDVKVLVDPTYLLTKAEWLNLFPEKKLESEKYILCYFLGNDETSFFCAKRFAELKKLKLVSILSDESSAPSDCTFADRTIIGAPVENFVNLIRGAEYVFTDSFHGTAFSIINEKQFFVTYRLNMVAKQSRNSRIDNILQMWNIEKRLIIDKNLDWSHITIDSINYNEVNKRLINRREEAYEFLRQALNFNENI